MTKVYAKKMHDSAQLPKHQTPGAAGFDLHLLEKLYLYPGERKLVSLGMAVQIPEGTALLLAPRSGLAMKYGLTIPNSPAIVDSDYRGLLKVILWNMGDDPFVAEAGERVCQGMVIKYVPCEFEWKDELDETSRGEGGFGSTGT